MLPHNFDKSWYSSMALTSLLLKSMLSCMYFEQRTVSATSGYLCFFLYGMSSTYKLYKEWWRVNSKYNSKELQHFGFSFCFTNLWSILWYGRPIGRIPILRYISAKSHTRTIGYLPNLRSTLIKSCWSFGPEWIISSNNFPSCFAELSYNILTFVLNLLAGMIGKSGKNHPVSSLF